MDSKTFKEIIAVLGWNQKTLAHRMGVTENTVSRWINETRKIPMIAQTWLNLALKLKYIKDSIDV